MMLTLYESIVRFEAVSKANRSRAESYNRGEDYELMKAKECEICAEEHEQLVSWLTELQDRREADRWVPVSERLPEDRHAVLVYCPENENVYCAFHDDKHWCIFGSYETVWEEVTHWRPLPKYKESEDK